MWLRNDGRGGGGGLRIDLVQSLNYKVRRLKPREGRGLAQGHTTNLWVPGYLSSGTFQPSMLLSIPGNPRSHLLLLREGIWGKEAKTQ